MVDPGVAFYSAPAPMSALPEHSALDGRPTDLDGMRRAVQGLLVHRDWAAVHGIDDDDLRLPEQNLRSTAEVLRRAFELSDRPIAEPREPLDRVVGICRHFALVHTALLRDAGIAARVRCGFANYFDREKWYDHWITERWNGDRWVRDDPQVDDLQASVIQPDFDVHDQPPGQFLTGAQAWAATRAGDVDPAGFGIFDMWGEGFIAGNVVSDFACLNKVELLPWDLWGMGLEVEPNQPVPEGLAAQFDELAALVDGDDLGAIRERYRGDDRLRVPSEVLTVADGELVGARIEG